MASRGRYEHNLMTSAIFSQGVSYTFLQNSLLQVLKVHQIHTLSHLIHLVDPRKYLHFVYVEKLDERIVEILLSFEF